MTGVGVRIIGASALVKRFAAAALDAELSMSRALYVEASRIMSRAVPITPILTGNLRASAFVDRPKITSSEVSVEFGFGGAAAPYAIYVHENLDAAHAPPTRAKFLEEPALEAEAGLAERLGLSMKLEI